MDEACHTALYTHTANMLEFPKNFASFQIYFSEFSLRIPNGRPSLIVRQRHLQNKIKSKIDRY